MQISELVADQHELIIRIDDNIDLAQSHIDQSQKELLKYKDKQDSRLKTKLVASLVLILLVFSAVFVVVM